MAFPRSILFVDGENLTMRFQEMVAAGRTPHDSVVHRPDTFVWHPRIMRNYEGELQGVARVCYYTSVVGDDQRVVEVKQEIAGMEFVSVLSGPDGAISGRIVPIVFKKSAKSKKTRNVDIQVVIDVMRFAFADEVQRVYLASGDGDYLPLINEVMRRGKQVEVLALSSGLNPALRYSADRFYLLDEVFFQANI